jgi:hypothetical protein
MKSLIVGFVMLILSSSTESQVLYDRDTLNQETGTSYGVRWTDTPEGAHDAEIRILVTCDPEFVRYEFVDGLLRSDADRNIVVFTEQGMKYCGDVSDANSIEWPAGKYYIMSKRKVVGVIKR